MGSPRTDAPLPPPFPVGTRLRYRGDRHVEQVAWNKKERREERVVLITKGIEVTIAEVRLGRRGTGKLLDEDDEIYDETRDGCSVYYLRPPAKDGSTFGRLIHNDRSEDWEVIGG